MIYSVLLMNFYIFNIIVSTLLWNYKIRYLRNIHLIHEAIFRILRPSFIISLDLRPYDAIAYTKT